MSYDDEWVPPTHLPWMDSAACAEVGGDLFHPEKGESARPAKRICAGCDVREQCLEYALATGQQEGIWGGLSPRERRATGRMVTQPTTRLDFAQVAFWVNAGYDDQQVAAQVGCSSKAVWRWRNENGIGPNSHGGGGRRAA